MRIPRTIRYMGVSVNLAMHVSYTLKYELGEANNTVIEVKEIG